MIVLNDDNNTDPFNELYPPMIEDDSSHSTSSFPELTSEIITHIIKSHKKRSDTDKKIISSFLLKTQLSINNDYDYITPSIDPSSSSSKIPIEHICEELGTLLYFKRIPKGTILHKINDVGDYFYFVFMGMFNILKPLTTVEATMSLYEYIDYLQRLLTAKEEQLFDMTIQKNNDVIPIGSLLRFNAIKHGLNKNKIKHMLYHTELTPDSLCEFLETYEETVEDYGMTTSGINEAYNKSIITEDKGIWNRYILPFIDLTTEDKKIIDRIKYTVKFYANEDGKVMITGHKYVIDQSAYQGDLIGNMYIEPDTTNITFVRRTRTVRAEENNVVGYISIDSYMELLFPEQKKNRIKYTCFLLQNFFFSTITQVQFDRYYFQLFNQFTLTHKTMVNHRNKSVSDLIFILKGEVKVTIDCSIIDIHNIIKFLIDQLEKNVKDIRNGLTADELKTIRKDYLNDLPMIKMITEHGTQINLVKEMNKKQHLQLYFLKDNDMLGIEELFLGCNYLTAAVVTSDVFEGFRIDKDDLKTLLLNESHCLTMYRVIAIKKLRNMMSRLSQIKDTFIRKFQCRINADEKTEVPRPVHLDVPKMNKSHSTRRVPMNQKNYVNCINSFYSDNQLYRPDRTLGAAMRLSNPFISKKQLKHGMSIPSLSQSPFNLNNTNNLSSIHNNLNHTNNQSMISNLFNDLATNRTTQSPHGNNINTARKPLIKQNTSISFDLKYKNEYITMESTVRHINQMNHMKFMSQMNETVRNNEGKVNKFEMKSIDLNLDMNNIMMMKNRLTFRHLNKCVVNKLNYFKKRQYNSLPPTANQNDIIEGIERVFDDNMARKKGGSNLIARKIKNYDQNKKLLGYTNYGLGTNSFHKSKKRKMEVTKSTILNHTHYNNINKSIN